MVLDHEHVPVTSEVSAPLSNAVDALGRAGATVVEGWPDGVDPVEQYESFGDHERRRMSARAAWSRYFNDIDVFLCPANFTPAFPHDNRPFEARTISTPEGERPYDSQPFWVSHASLPGLPAAVVPVGIQDGGAMASRSGWRRLGRG